MDGVTAMVVGPGNLGAMLAEALALEPAVGKVVVAGRRPERCQAVAGQARLIAAIHGRRPEVVVASPDWSGDGVDLAVLAPTLQSWWVLNELPEPARAPLRALGLGAWLPFPLAPLIEVMEQLGADPFSVIVSFPDITGPVLRGMGYEVGCGLGNVSEVAAKFPRPVRLVAHHSLGPHAFGSYGSYGGELPPYLVDMPKDEADAIIRSAVAPPHGPRHEPRHRRGGGPALRGAAGRRPRARPRARRRPGSRAAIRCSRPACASSSTCAGRSRRRSP